MSSRTRFRSSGISRHSGPDPVTEPEFEPVPQPPPRLDPVGEPTTTSVEEDSPAVAVVPLSGGPDEASTEGTAGSATAVSGVLTPAIAPVVDFGPGTRSRDDPLTADSAWAVRARAGTEIARAARPISDPECAAHAADSPVEAAAVLPGPSGIAMSAVVSAVPINVSSLRRATAAPWRPARR
ncbi:hypothetical protein [Nocardia sp. NBC_01329]|uniref:hypothetical protein n=1 Tax=Nocardia sp. NBC_01329 TaxID=2903594 RepID=UPI002E11DF10|nr:hypothetical protein OG405_04810 [Nocardia sp. NBC_01329]